METLTAFVSAYSVSLTIVFIVVAIVLRNRNKKLKNEIKHLDQKLDAQFKALNERNNEISILQIKVESAHKTIKSLQETNKELLEKASDDVTINIKGSDVDIDKVVQQRRQTKKSNGRSATGNNKTSKEGEGSGNNNGSIKN